MKKNLAVLGLLAAVGGAHAASIYVFSCTNGVQDQAVVNALIAEGHDAVLGQPVTGFTNLNVVSQYEAVYLQANYNWGFSWTPAQQQTMLNYINAGGALVTAEWILWMTGTGSFQTLKAAFPMVETSAFDSPTSVNYIQDQAEPLVNAGLPTSFTCPMTNIAGVKTNVTQLKANAKSFYTNGTYKMVAGWNYGNGRVVNFNTVNGVAQLENLEFRQLLGNTFVWATSNPPAGPGISGNIHFQNYFGAPVQTASIAYIDDATGIGSGRVTVSLLPNGNFTAPGPNVPGTYRVLIRGSHWLRKMVVTTTATGSTPNIGTVSLINGDVDGDNEVGPSDFSFLSAAFGSVLGDFGYRPGADLDGDEEVGPSDFSILATNFGEVGD